MQFNLSQGLNSIGIYKRIDSLRIENIVDQKVEKIFTIINGIWQSWVNGIPDEYQGFLTFEKGYGYTVVCTESTNLIINDHGNFLTPSELPMNSTGISYIAGIDTLYMQEAMFNRYKQSKSYTVINGTWKSWLADVPDAYQGFLQMELGKGYVTNVIELLFEIYQPSAFPYIATFGILTKKIVPKVTSYSDYSDTMLLVLD